jgi:hypothetical protein
MCEYTEQPLAEQFSDNGQLAFDRLSAGPGPSIRLAPAFRPPEAISHAPSWCISFLRA